MKPLLWTEIPTSAWKAMRSEGINYALWPIASPIAKGDELQGFDWLLVESLSRAVSAQTGIIVLPTLPVLSSPLLLAQQLTESFGIWHEQGFERVVLMSARQSDVHALEVARQMVEKTDSTIAVSIRWAWDMTTSLQEAAKTSEGRRMLSSFLFPQLNQEQDAGEGQNIWDALVEGWTRHVKREMFLAQEQAAPSSLLAENLFQQTEKRPPLREEVPNALQSLFRAPGAID